MLQRIVSIMLIFSVNIFLLAGVIMPHHHHDGVPHFAFFELFSDHTHDGCCCNHQDGDSCSYELEVDLFSDDTKQDDHCVVCGAEHDHSLQLLQALLPFLIPDSFAPDDTSSELPPYLIGYRSAELCRTNGLRAPPAVL